MKIILAFTMFACLHLRQTDAVCGSAVLTTQQPNKAGSLEYNKGTTNSRENCTWTFNNKNNKYFILVLWFRTLVFRSFGNSSITLPDGTHVNASNGKMFSNKCLKFVRENTGSGRCNLKLKDKFCSSPAVEVKTWPPTLRSSVMSRSRNNRGVYIYPLNFVMHYQFFECRNDTTETNTITHSERSKHLAAESNPSVIVLACLVAFFAAVSMVSLYFLYSKTRKERVNNNNKYLDASCLKGAEDMSDSVCDNSIKESSSVLKENEAQQMGNTYSKVEEVKFRTEEDPSNIYASISNSQIVENVIYESL